MITRSGWTVAATTVVLITAGATLGYPELFALGVAGVVSLVAAAAWMAAHPRVRAIRRIEPARVMQGEPAHGVLTVTNIGPRRSPPFAATEAVGRARVTVALPSLGSGRSHEAVYPLPTGRRGVHQIGPLTIGHRDPFGLMYSARSYPSHAVLRVGPRLHPVVPLPTGRSHDMDGRTSAASQRGGIAFHSLREYERGDDLRLIHWKSTARTGSLMVRHTVVPHEPRMMIVLDTSAEPYTDASFEDAVRVAASLAISGFDGGYPVEVRTTGGLRVRAERGESGRGGLLDLFADVGRDHRDGGLQTLAGSRVDGAVALGVVTGEPSVAGLAVVSALRRRFAMVSIALLGPGPGPAPPMVTGTFTIRAASSADFATAWNRAVQR